MTNSETAALTEVTCRRCRMSFRAAAPADSRHSGVTICAEPGCSVSFWHLVPSRAPGVPYRAQVSVYPVDVVAHRAAWLADIEAGDAA